MGEDGAQIFPLALADFIGTSRFSRMHVANTGISGLGKREGYVDELEVQVSTLDTVASENSLRCPDVVKIDVEGAEAAVLRGGKHIFTATDRPGIVVVEALSTPDGEMNDDEVSALLEQYGYSVERLVRDDGSVQERENYLCRRID
jgi:hypothetical protein